MFNVTGLDAVLIQKNRNSNNSPYDDKDSQSVNIKVSALDVDMAVKYGIYTTPEAKGYFIVKNNTDVLQGDQLIFNNHKYTVLEIKDMWIWNHLANIILVVK